MEKNMTEKVVDMAVIHKITQLTDAVLTLQQNTGAITTVIKRMTEMLMQCDDRIKDLYQENRSLRQMLMRHIYDPDGLHPFEKD